MAISVQHGPSTGAYAMPMYKAGRNLEQYERVQNFIKQLLQKYGIDAPIESREKMQEKELTFGREQMGQQERQFARQLGFSQEQLAQSSSQFARQFGLSERELAQMRELELGQQQLQSRSLSQQQQIAMAELAARQNMASQQAALARLPYQQKREEGNLLATNLGYGNLVYGSYAAPNYRPVSAYRGRSMNSIVARG